MLHISRTMTYKNFVIHYKIILITPIGWVVYRTSLNDLAHIKIMFYCAQRGRTGYLGLRLYLAYCVTTYHRSEIKPRFGVD